MNVTIQEVSPIEKKMLVEVPWELVETKLKSAFADIGRAAQVKGYRPGKAPRKVIERIYGGRVKAEVAAELIRESFFTATTEHELDAVSEPRIEELPQIKKGESLTFEATVEVKGTPEVKNFKGLTIKKRKLVIPENAVQDGLEALQKDFIELVPIESVRTETSDQDVITIQVAGKADEIDLNHDGLQIDLGDTARDPLPGLIAALTGIPVDAKDHKIELTFDENHQSLGGKTANMTISIVDAKTKSIPELDDEFAKDTGRAETITELRTQIENEIKERLEKQIDQEFKDQALKSLIEANEIPVANALVERAIDMRFRRLQQMFGLGNSDELMSGEMRESMREGALSEVRGQLLLEALSDKESIEITEEMVAEHIDSLAAERDMPAAKLRAQLQKDNQLESVRFSMRQEKALDLIIEHGTVELVDQIEEPHVHDENCNHGPDEHTHEHEHVHDENCNH